MSEFGMEMEEWRGGFCSLRERAHMVWHGGRGCAAIAGRDATFRAAPWQPKAFLKKKA